ncbi:MAG: DUF5710 domain-containing protein [Methylococcaceae bacterium]
MVDSIIYLNVPYAQKDAAKALGAKWDATNKKWYVPANKDMTLFVKWQTENNSLESPSTTVKPESGASSAKTSSSVNNTTPGVITYPIDKNFVAYNGDKPPWD